MHTCFSERVAFAQNVEWGAQVKQTLRGDGQPASPWVLTMLTLSPPSPEPLPSSFVLQVSSYLYFSFSLGQ